jgi:serine/threonine protein kinase
MRRRDGKLFLLDFGAVKQVANAPSGSAVSTGIYSMGFAPPEQMSGSQVFPSTDLYAFAVTLITLMTGQEANQLFDAYTNQWKWQTQITVNPRLADILDKMLLAAASQRFQSAQEVLEALFAPSSVPSTVLPQPQTQLPPLPQLQTQPPPLPQPRQLPVPVQPAFATWELLAGAAFSGFEGALIAIALFSIVKNPIITLAIAFVVLGILIFSQTKRWLEKFDLLIIAGINFAIILFFPYLRGGIVLQQVVILAIAAALISIAITTLFRLIYKLLSSIL